METNIPTIARSIYGGIARQGGTIELGLDECAPPDAPVAEKLRIESEILMLLWLEGMNVALGDDVTPATLTQAQINYLAQYVRSYGYALMIRSDELTNPPPVGEARQRLEDFRERFYDFEGGKWREVSFQKLRIHRA